MPQKPLHQCAKPGCRNLTRDKYCALHNKRPPDNRASPAERGYTYQWRKQSKAFLAAHPWCAICKAHNRYVPATEVDHKTPHKGNQKLFWDENNWQALCHRCHSQKTAKEDGGFGHGKQF